MPSPAPRAKRDYRRSSDLTTGLACPACGRRKGHEVYNTIYRRDVVLRRRVCGCGQRFGTVELREQDLVDAVTSMQLHVDRLRGRTRGRED